MTDELVIGRVRKPHGIHGELKIESLSGDLDHFHNLSTLILQRGQQREEHQIEGVRFASGLVLVRLKGVSTPEAAKRWRGWEVVASRDHAAPLADGEVYYADLVGLTAFSGDDNVGVVSSVLEGGPWPFLEVRLATGETRVVPFQEHFVGPVDLESGRIEILDSELLD